MKRKCRSLTCHLNHEKRPFFFGFTTFCLSAVALCLRFLSESRCLGWSDCVPSCPSCLVNSWVVSIPVSTLCFGASSKSASWNLWNKMFRSLSRSKSSPISPCKRSISILNTAIVSSFAFINWLASCPSWGSRWVSSWVAFWVGDWVCVNRYSLSSL